MNTMQSCACAAKVEYGALSVTELQCVNSDVSEDSGCQFKDGYTPIAVTMLATLECNH